MVRCEFALARVPARRGCQRLVQLARSASCDIRAGFDAREAMTAGVSASEGWLRVAMSRHATRNEPRQTVANTHAITIAWRSRTKMARLGGAENIGPERAKTASATPIPVRRVRVRSIENLGNFQAQRDRERAIRCHGGGEGGIRTHGPLRDAGFQNRSVRPTPAPLRRASAVASAVEVSSGRPRSRPSR
jgi:hypothetical protein